MTAEYGGLYWAHLSAVFAALTAICAKIGLKGVDSRSRHSYSHFCDHDQPRRVRVLRRAME